MSSASASASTDNDGSVISGTFTQCPASSHFQEKNNDMKVLLSMAVGLTLNDTCDKVFTDYTNDVRFPLGNKYKWNPKRTDLVDEIIRRKLIASGVPSATNKQMKKPVALAWLKEHPITNEEDIDFIRSKVSTFLINVRLAEAEKAETFGKRDQWSGIIPLLRLIHCLVDFDDIKEALQTSFSTKSRQEIDGRNNTETMRVDPWSLVADKWNDRGYNPNSTVFDDLHDEFRKCTDISHKQVEGMGKCTPDKAKKKFFSMKNDLIPIKNNWEKSGNGDGSVQASVRDDSSIDSSEQELINANDKRNFLNGKSPAILYLWAQAERNDLLRTVCQQVENSIGRDSAEGNNASGLTHRGNKRKATGNGDGGEDPDLKSLRETMSTTNANLERSDARRERQELRKLISDYEDKILQIEARIETAKEKGRAAERLEVKLNRFEVKVDELEAELESLQQKILEE